MMRRPRSLLADRSASAAAEMALVLPLLLIIMFGAAELGNYFMNEHSLIKSVRDGARFAARQNFSNYTACAGSPGGSVVADTKNVVINGYLAGGSSLLTPNIQASDITVTTNCAVSAGGENMLGIYKERASGAQRVKVTASVTYRPILAAFGFSGVGFTLNAASEAAVAGL